MTWLFIDVKAFIVHWDLEAKFRKSVMQIELSEYARELRRKKLKVEWFSCETPCVIWCRCRYNRWCRCGLDQGRLFVWLEKINFTLKSNHGQCGKRWFRYRKCYLVSNHGRTNARCVCLLTKNNISASIKYKWVALNRVYLNWMTFSQNGDRLWIYLFDGVNHTDED